MEKTKVSKVSPQAKFIAVVTAIVVVIAIALALLLYSAPSSKLELDLTSNNLYGVTPVTKTLLSGLEDDIEIVVITDEASLDKRLTKFLDKYAALSGHVVLTYIDPVKQPSVLEKYGVEQNTVVVKNNTTGKSTTVAVSGFSGYDSALLLYDYMSYYMYGQLTMVSFDAEGQLDSAINTVTGKVSHKIYYMAGHGEKLIASQVSELVEKANYDTQVFELLTQGSIPADCELLICNSPTSDLSGDELSLIKNWLADGGKMMLVCDDPTLTNFCGLMNTYGINMEQGHLADPENVYQNYISSFGYYCFWPLFKEESEICEGINASAMIIGARPMTFITPARRGILTDYFMCSSESGVNYIDGQEELMQGSFIVGALATEELTEEKQARLTVISTSNFADEALLTNFGSISNLTVFMNAINANFGDIETISVAARNVSIQQNTFVSTTLWSVFFVGIVPAVFIVGGLVFWSRRRKK